MIRSRYLPTATATMVLLLATVVSTPTSGTQPASASPSPGPGTGPDHVITQADAVELVLASDPRFAGLPDWEFLRRKTAAEFTPYILLESNYHVLPTTSSDLAFWEVPPRVPGSWLIAVTLVEDCVEPPTDGSSMTVDPCGWRHTWYHRVQPDGARTLLFDEGDADDASGTPPLVGTEWALKAIGTARLDGDPAWLLFAADFTVSGFAGCNVFTGPYTTSGADIAIGPLIVSDRVCAADVMEIEGVFLEALQDAPRWWFWGDLLKIGTDDQLSPSMVTVLTFQAVGG